MSAELNGLEEISKLYDLNRPKIKERIDGLKTEIREKEDEIEALVMMKINR